MLRCVVRVLRGQSGHSAIEYAVLLGLLVLIVGGGAIWLGSASTHSLSLLAGQMAGTSPASTSTGTSSSNSSPSATEPSPHGASPEADGRFAPATWGALALGSGVIGLGVILLVRRRGRVVQQEIPQDDSVLANLAERFSTKRQHLLRLLSQDPSILFKNQLAVRHLMTTDVITVTPGTTRQQIGELMRDSHIRHMLVCDSGQQLLGVVSDRDLSNKPGKTANELMSSHLRTVSPETLISPSTTYIIHAGISSLPVVEDGRLCGILTTTDLILALQCVLQLWLHAASMMQGEVWEQEFMQRVESQLDAADPEICFGVKGVFEALMERA